MKKSKMSNNQDFRILVCREVENEDVDKKYYYKCSSNEKMVFYENQYIYKFVFKDNKRQVKLFQIINVLEAKGSEENFIEVEENEKLCPILLDYKNEVPKWMLDELANSSIKMAEKLIKRIIFFTKIELAIAKKEGIDNERKKYLFDTFGVEDRCEFDKRKRSGKERWYSEFNKYDMDFQFIIRMYELQSQLFQIIESNEEVSNADKVALKSKCRDQIEKNVDSIIYREHARHQMDSYLGVEEEKETKQLVWAHMSPIEFKIEFSFFWTVVKSLLSMAYVPAVMILLQNENSKIYLYIILVLVYLVALIFSDEEQVDKLLKWINETAKEKIGYADLYYFGLTLTLSALLFSVELVLGVVENITDAIIYLFAGVMIIYSILVIINVLVSLVAWGASLLVSLRDIRKNGYKIRKTIRNVFFSIMWLLSICCSVVVVHRHNIIPEHQEGIVGLALFIIVIGFVIAILKIITLWKSDETK